MIENINRRKKIITTTIVGIIVVLVTLITVTYAWFSASSKADEQTITTAKTKLIVEIPEEAEHIKDIKPTTWNDDMTTNNNNFDIARIPINVINESSIDIKYNLSLSAEGLKLNDETDADGNKLVGGLLSDIKYKLYSDDDDNKNEIMNGYLSNPTHPKIIIKNKDISINKTHKYILYLYIKEKNAEQNKLQKLDFDIIINGDAIAPEQNDIALADKILEDSGIKKEQNFTATSQDNGLYEVETSKGTAYYYRGPVENNFVELGTNKTSVQNLVFESGTTYKLTEVAQKDSAILWRIVSINEDGSITLISKNDINSNDWYTWDNNNYDSMKNKVNEWFESTFTEPELSDMILDTEFCYDMRDITTNDSAVSKRLSKSPAEPTLECRDQDVFISKAGLITADQMIYAGAYTSNTPNNVTYLNNSTFFWIMSPLKTNRNYVWSPRNLEISSDDGKVASDGLEALVRPVITLSYDSIFLSGTGSEDSPYKLLVK